MVTSVTTMWRLIVDMAAYEYKVKGLFKVDAQVAGEVCEKLQNSPQGLSPETLLEASSDASAPLHDEFEWRDDVAAQKYRLQQAANLIRCITLVVDTNDIEGDNPRAFVCTPGNKSAYVSLKSALSNDVWREHLLKQARDELRWFQGKYRQLDELAGVNAEIDKFLRNVG